MGFQDMKLRSMDSSCSCALRGDRLRPVLHEPIGKREPLNKSARAVEGSTPKHPCRSDSECAGT